MPPPHFTPIKVCFNGEIHRFTWDIETHAYGALRMRFCETFPQLANDAFVIQYTDLQGDVVTISSDTEYYNACDQFRLVDGTCKLMRFTAVAHTKTAAFQEHVADPILKAIEKLVETLNAAMEKVKHEDWKARAQSGVEYTNEVLQGAAKEAGEALHGAANEARESLDTVCESIREIPFDQMLKDTTDGIKVAAEGISVFAQEVVAEMQKEKLVQDATERLKTAAETVAEFAKDAVDELKNLQLPHGAMPFVPTPAASVAPVAPVAPVEQQAAEVVAAEVVAEVVAEAPVSSADSDWEQVAAQTAVVEETAAAVEDEIVEVQVSAEEQKWAAQLATIRDIFPDVDTCVAIERLEQANGDVQVVLNALMEAM